MHSCLRLPFVHSVAAFFAIANSAFCVADQTANRVDEIIVISSRIPLPLRRVASSVSVMTEEELALHGSLTLAESLRQLPAISTSTNGGIGKTTSLRIRGEEGFRTLAMIDGIRISDPSGPQIASQLEHLLASGIGRVEVLRGPQGLAYGADAGGVISISSVAARQGLQSSVDTQVGSFGTRSIAAALSGSNAVGDFSVMAADLSADGFNERKSDTTLRDKDGYDNATVHLRAGVNLGTEWKAELVHHRVNGESAFDDCGFGTPQHDCRADFEQRATRMGLSYQNENFRHSLSWSSTDTDRDSLAAGASVFATQGKLQRWDYVGSAMISNSMTVVWGADHERDAIGAIERRNNGVFAEALATLHDNWFVTAGVRHDQSAAFGNNDSYRLTTAYLIEEEAGSTLKLKASYGTGFRAPSPYEAAFNKGPFAYPPASLIALQQELSKGYEAGVEYLAASGARAEVVYFNQQVRDAIDFDLGSFSGYLQDKGRSNSNGVELSGSLPITAAFALQANATWNDTERPNGQQRLRRPRWLANAGVRWQATPEMEMHAFARLSRDAIDQDFTGVKALDDYVVTDIGGSYQFNKQLQAYLRIDNLFDRRYQELLGYNTPERAAYVGVRWRFADR